MCKSAECGYDGMEERIRIPVSRLIHFSVNFSTLEPRYDQQFAASTVIVIGWCACIGNRWDSEIAWWGWVRLLEWIGLDWWDWASRHNRANKGVPPIIPPFSSPLLSSPLLAWFRLFFSCCVLWLEPNTVDSAWLASSEADLFRCLLRLSDSPIKLHYSIPRKSLLHSITHSSNVGNWAIEPEAESLSFAFSLSLSLFLPFAQIRRPAHNPIKSNQIDRWGFVLMHIYAPNTLKTVS